MKVLTMADIFYESPKIKRTIISSYWLVILLALPLWWNTTSIQRLSLPLSRVGELSGKQLQFPIEIGPEHLQNVLQKHILANPTRWDGLSVSFKSPGVYKLKPEGDELVLKDRTLTYPPNLPSSELASVLADLIAPHSNTNRVAQYANRYRLAFTLLNEDSSAGKVITGWDIQDAISDQIAPTLDSLSILHNFTIESQVQFHAPLAFTPRDLGNGAFGITPEDLTVFVNSAEWTLSSSVSSDPVLHFVIFIPSAFRKSLHILNANREISPSSSFILPQWGGIIIYNPPTPSSPDQTQIHIHLDLPPLAPLFQTFASHLRLLLGVPSLPPSVTSSSENQGSNSITEWQLDALLRRRIKENTRESKDTLGSIVSLVERIRNMPVGKKVKDDVLGALDALEKVHTLPAQTLSQTLLDSAHALSHSSRAFFNPGMLALLYFPAEHKYAVYTPLFASAGIPLLGALVKEGRRWVKERRERNADVKKVEREKVD